MKWENNFGSQNLLKYARRLPVILVLPKGEYNEDFKWQPIKLTYCCQCKDNKYSSKPQGHEVLSFPVQASPARQRHKLVIFFLTGFCIWPLLLACCPSFCLAVCQLKPSYIDLHTETLHVKISISLFVDGSTKAIFGVCRQQQCWWLYIFAQHWTRIHSSFLAIWFLLRPLYLHSFNIYTDPIFWQLNKESSW